MWPTQQGVWGRDWQQQQQQALQLDVPVHDPVYVTAGGAAPSKVTDKSQQQQQQQQKQQQRQLPEWLYGLHSWRYGDGPEWIKGLGGSTAPYNSNGQQQQQQPPANRSAVVWVTGRAAQQVGQLSDEQVLQDLQLLLQTYPAIPRPGGQPGSNGGSSGVSLEGCRLVRSSWTRSSNFRGSYSYPSNQADGSTAVALAAPLTAAAAAGAAAGGGGPGNTERPSEAVSSSSCSGNVSGSGSSSEQLLVCFAGEATSRHHMGTVHGAFNSGVREAHRLLQSWGLLQSQDTGAGAAADGQQAPADYHAAFWL
jgi:hypothetical protein